VEYHGMTASLPLQYFINSVIGKSKAVNKLAIARPMGLHFHAVRLNFSYISKFLVSQIGLKKVY
jgi:hypothetical protein